MATDEQYVLGSEEVWSSATVTAVQPSAPPGSFSTDELPLPSYFAGPSLYPLDAWATVPPADDEDDGAAQLASCPVCRARGCQALRRLLCGHLLCLTCADAQCASSAVQLACPFCHQWTALPSGPLGLPCADAAVQSCWELDRQPEEQTDTTDDDELVPPLRLSGRASELIPAALTSKYAGQPMRTPAVVNESPQVMRTVYVHHGSDFDPLRNALSRHYLLPSDFYPDDARFESLKFGYYPCFVASFDMLVTCCRQGAPVRETVRYERVFVPAVAAVHNNQTALIELLVSTADWDPSLPHQPSPPAGAALQQLVAGNMLSWADVWASLRGKLTEQRRKAHSSMFASVTDFRAEFRQVAADLYCFPYYASSFSYRNTPYQMIINAQTDSVTDFRPWGTGTVGTIARGAAYIAGQLAWELFVDSARRSAYPRHF